MAKTIVFFNLADMHDKGLVDSSVKALRRKYQSYSGIYEFFAGANQIYQVDLFGLLRKEGNKSGVPPVPINLVSGHTACLPEIAREHLAISMLCGRADKIMLGIHGHYDDTEQGFAGLGWDRGSGVVGKCEQFAKLVSTFLVSSKSYKLALIVCFGARSENFRVNHDGDLDPEDIKSSFAYKFFRAICTKADVTMTARTGSVAFDSQTGRSLVQTEAAVSAEIEQAELQEAEETKRIALAYEALERSMTVDQEGVKKFYELLERMDSPNAVASNPQERIVKEYNGVKALVNDLGTRSTKLVPKYGKFVYTYTKGKVTVCRKYEGGKKVMKVIYHGEL